jgi:two-component system, cell cycle response regulator
MENAELVAENRALRRLLQTLTNDAAYNESVMRRFQERELALLTATDLGHLIERLTVGLRASFSLDDVQLVLFDPYWVLDELLSNLGTPPANFPHLRLEHDMRGALADYADHYQPWLGCCDKETQQRLFPQGRVCSAAVLPLRQPDGLSGFLHLGSRSRSRFVSGQGTDFLQRLAGLAAVCLENAVNRERLRLSGLTDGLTGLYNRRHLDARLQEEIARACRHSHPLSCLFIDADHFKRINDKHGHAAGDQVLVALSKRIRDQLRGSDLAARYGGEEIAVLLPQTDAANARRLAERIRAHVRASHIPLSDGEEISISVSIGVAQLDSDCDQPPEALARQLLAAADREVYRAKAEGRDCVCCAN